VKKYNNIKAIFRIPRPRITPALSRNTPEQSIEMNAIESIQGMNTEQIFQATIAKPFQVQVQAFNIGKYNENLISFPGISFLVLYFLALLGVAVGSRYGWISLVQIQLYWYVGFCCLPVILPTVYFTQNPNHLIIVMRDLDLL
jgi:hypothetical protein